jgi:hypothetical protein
VRGDRDRVAQILLNLLSNAVKCTDAGGEIHLACESDAGGVRIHVRDTGRGIEPERQKAIFEPFVQLAPERTLAQGVGLGLSISRELARAMEGDRRQRAGKGLHLHAHPPGGTPRLPRQDRPGTRVRPRRLRISAHTRLRILPGSPKIGGYRGTDKSQRNGGRSVSSVPLAFVCISVPLILFFLS